MKKRMNASHLFWAVLIGISYLLLTVLIETKSVIAKMMIDTPEMKGAIKASADAVTGKNMRVLVEQYKEKAEPAAEDKLERLKKFGNIKFE